LGGWGVAAGGGEGGGGGGGGEGGGGAGGGDGGGGGGGDGGGDGDGGDGGGDGGGGAIFQVPSGSTGLRRHREPSGSTTQLWPGALKPLGWLHLKK